MTADKKKAGVLYEVIKVINQLPREAVTIDDEKRMLIELTGCVEKLELVVESEALDPGQKEQLEGMMTRWRQRIAKAKERIERGTM